jgi:hypothetical protein
MDVWFCVMRRNRAERLNRESMNRLKKKLGALPSAKRILAPLDKDLSWKSANRTSESAVKGPICPFCRPIDVSFSALRDAGLVSFTPLGIILFCPGCDRYSL